MDEASSDKDCIGEGGVSLAERSKFGNLSQTVVYGPAADFNIPVEIIFSS